MELSENPEERARDEDRFDGVTPDWARYNHKDAGAKNALQRYRIPSEYLGSLREINMHLTHAVSRMKQETDVRTWLEDLAPSIDCDLVYTRKTQTFTIAEFTTLLFTAHEFTINYIPSVKLYVVTVCEHAAASRPRLYDYLFFHAY